MDVAQFIKGLADVFEDTDPAIINADTEFQTLDDWDSLAALSIIAMVKRNYGVKLAAGDIRACKTVADLYNLVSA